METRHNRYLYRYNFILLPSKLDSTASSYSDSQTDSEPLLAFGSFVEQNSEACFAESAHTAFL